MAVSEPSFVPCLFFRLFGQYGPFFFLFSIISVLFNSFLRFRFYRIPGLLHRIPFLSSCFCRNACCWKLSTYFWSFLIAFFTSCLPLPFLFLWGITCVRVIYPPLVGIAILCFGMFFLSFAWGYLSWLLNQWRLTVVTVASLCTAFASLICFEIAAAAWKWDFMTFSCVTLSFSMLPLCYLVHLLAPEASLDFAHFVPVQKHDEESHTLPAPVAVPAPVPAPEVPALAVGPTPGMDLPDPDTERMLDSTKLFQRSAWYRRLRLILASVISFMFLAAYGVVVYIIKRRAQGIIIAGTTLLMDCLILLYAVGQRLSSPGVVVLLHTLTRVTLVIPGPEYWILGHSALYLFWGVALSFSIAVHRVSLVDRKVARRAELYRAIDRHSSEPADPEARSITTCRRVGRVLCTPEFLLLLTTLCFVALLVGVSFSYLKGVDLMGRYYQQWIFGIAAICLVAFTLLFVLAVLLYWKNGWNLNVKTLICASLGDLVSIGCGIFAARVTFQYVILASFVCVPPLIAILLYLNRRWVANDYDLFAPATQRRPPNTMFLEALIQRGLPRRDYIILALLVVFPILLAGYSLVVHVATRQWIAGWSIFMVVMELILTFYPLIKYFNTLRISPAVVVSLIGAVALLVGYMSALCSTSMYYSFIVIVAYPTLIVLGTAIYKWQDDHWELSKYVVIATSITMVLLLGGCVMLLIYVREWYISVSVLFVYCFGLFCLLVAFSWARRRFSLARVMYIVIGVFLLLCTGLGIAVGFASRQFFVGFSITWWCIVSVLAVYGGLHAFRRRASMHFSSCIFPVYSYNVEDNTVSPASFDFSCIYLAVIAALFWGLLASLFVKPACIGLAVAALCLVFLFTFSLSLMRHPHLVSLVSTYVHTADLMACCAQARQRQLGGTEPIVADDPLHATASTFIHMPTPTPTYGPFLAATARSDSGVDPTGPDEPLVASSISIGSLSTVAGPAPMHACVESHHHHDAEPRGHDGTGRAASSDDGLVTERAPFAQLSKELRGMIFSSPGRTLADYKEHLHALMQLDCARDRAWVDECRFAAHFRFLVAASADAEKCLKETELLRFFSEMGFSDLYLAELRSLSSSDQQSIVRLFEEYQQRQRALEELHRHHLEEELRDHLRREEEISIWLEAERRRMLYNDPQPTATNQPTHPHPHLRPPLPSSPLLSGTSESARLDSTLIRPSGGGRGITQTSSSAVPTFSVLGPSEPMLEPPESESSVCGCGEGEASTAWSEGEEGEVATAVQVGPGEGDEPDLKGLIKEAIKAGKRDTRDQVMVADEWNKRMRHEDPNHLQKISHLHHGPNEQVLISELPPGAKFIDEQFPPQIESIWPDTQPPEAQHIADWRHPEQYAPSPMLFNGINPDDIKQGDLGDCWLLSALSVLAMDQRRIRHLFRYANMQRGVFTVRFFKNGEWHEVVIDDLLPCNRRGRPVFATSGANVNELWVSLLEKAYAKLHRSYKAIEGGLVHQGLVDLTGGTGECIDLTNKDVRREAASGQLWKRLKRYSEAGYLLGAGTPAGSDREVVDGLVQGHAYAILAVREEDGVCLIKLRNPWGHQEWAGAWSANSSLWTRRLRTKFGYTAPEKGNFFMSFEDFCSRYAIIYICKVFGPEWHRVTMESEWKGPTAGGCSNFHSVEHNPQFALRVTRPTRCFISLTQQDRRADGIPPFHIGFMVLNKGGKRCRGMYQQDLIAFSGNFANTREVQCEATLHPLSHGYTVLPSTFRPNEECKFWLNVFSDEPITLTPLDPMSTQDC